MASYVVMEPPGDRPSADPVFVRDGFAWLGLILPVVWLLWHRLWIEALLFLAVSLGLGVWAEYGAGAAIVPVLSLLLALFVGLEGAALRLFAWRRRGWNEWGVVEAESREDAETRYVAEAMRDAPSPRPAPAPASMTPGRAPASGDGPALGLFDYPGRG